MNFESIEIINLINIELDYKRLNLDLSRFLTRYRRHNSSYCLGCSNVGNIHLVHYDFELFIHYAHCYCRKCPSQGSRNTWNAKLDAKNLHRCPPTTFILINNETTFAFWARTTINEWNISWNAKISTNCKTCWYRRRHRPNFVEWWCQKGDNGCGIHGKKFQRRRILRKEGIHSRISGASRLDQERDRCVNPRQKVKSRMEICCLCIGPLFIVRFYFNMSYWICRHFRWKLHRFGYSCLEHQQRRCFQKE